MITTLILTLIVAVIIYRRQRNKARRLAEDRKMQLDRFRLHIAHGSRIRLPSGESGTVDYAGTDIITVYTDNAEYKHLNKSDVMPICEN